MRKRGDFGSRLFVKLLFFFSICLLTKEGKAEISCQPMCRESMDSLVRWLHRLDLEYRSGYIFPTNSFVSGRNEREKPLRHEQALHIRYGFQFAPTTNAYRIFGGVYQGIGLGYNCLGDLEELGNPWALYLFQGGRICSFSSRMSFNYEWNFGLSLGWKPYDSESNPFNTVIGSKINAYLNTNFYLNWVLSPRLDLITGVTLTHFSNGNTSFPNAGINVVDGKVGVCYYFNRQDLLLSRRSRVSLLSVFPRHISYDLVLFGAWRRKGYFQDEEFVYSPKAYQVWGANFAIMYNCGYQFRLGTALDWVYDASSNVFVKSDTDSPTGFVDPPFNAQVALGVSGRAEFVRPFFIVGIGMGWNVIHRGGDLDSFYQLLTLKITMTRNLFLHIGYSLKEFQDPNFLMLGIGYRFNNRYPKNL